MAELHWTEVDGVTTIWTESPTPLRAGLFFRTGRADESLVTAGQTHLIEHLALSTMSDPAVRHNGFVTGVTSGFFTVGTPEDVSSFLANICTALTSLPGDRLENEKKVLAAEISTRQYDLRSNLLTWRFGAAGYGLVGMPEYGIRRATLEQLHEYGAQRFTKGNAILWLTGPPPADLHLRLPDGKKQQIPLLVPIQNTFPSWLLDNMCGGVAAGAIVPRDNASTIFREIAHRRLREQLRSVKAVSYAPFVFYDPLTADTAHLVLYADSDMDHRAELANEFGEVFKGLAEVDETEVETARKHIREFWSGTLAPPPEERVMQETMRATTDWILGREFESLEMIEAQMSSVTAADVAKFSHDVNSSVMFALPGKASLKPWVGEKAPFSVEPPVKGQEIQNIDAPIRRERLVHGSDGVSVIFPDGSHLTVRYSKLAAALKYKDGGVQLVGFDACSVVVEPKLWKDGGFVCFQICERIPEHLLLDQGARPADAIPMPTTTSWQRFRARLSKLWHFVW